MFHRKTYVVATVVAILTAALTGLGAGPADASMCALSGAFPANGNASRVNHQGCINYVIGSRNPTTGKRTFTWRIQETLDNSNPASFFDAGEISVRIWINTCAGCAWTSSPAPATDKNSVDSTAKVGSATIPANAVQWKMVVDGIWYSNGQFQLWQSTAGPYNFQ